MNCILIEDEEASRLKLKKLLEKIAEVTVVDEAASLQEGLAAMRNHPETELLFLDIQLPDGTGFDLMEALKNPPKVIFVTNYETYALRAFEINALDYIQKPVTASRLKRALQRIRSDTPLPPSSTRLKPDDLIVLTQNSQKFFTRVSDITLIESDDSYTRITRADRKQFMMKKSMSAWEQQLPPEQFRRIDRKHIVNLCAVDRLEHSGALRFKTAMDPLVLKRAAKERLQSLVHGI